MAKTPAALDAQYLLDHQPNPPPRCPLARPALVDILIDSERTLRRLHKAEAHPWEKEFAEFEERHNRWHSRDPLPEDEMLGRAFQNSQQTFARLERRRDILQRTYHRTLHDLPEIRTPAYSPPPPPPPRPRSGSRSGPRSSSKPSVAPAPTPSSQKAKSGIGLVPENPSPCGCPSRETLQPAQERQKEQPQTAPKPSKNAA